MDSENNKKIIATVVVVFAVALLGVVGSSLAKDGDADESPTTTTSSPSPSTNTSTSNTSITPVTSSNSTTATGTYKDGTYTESTSYQSPGGIETISVTVTISNGTINSASVQQDANNRDSEEYQTRFANNYKSKVTGKSIDGLSISRVSGASLTTDGFNNALEAIRIKAQA